MTTICPATVKGLAGVLSTGKQLGTFKVVCERTHAGVYGITASFHLAN
jgi:hypothetical protein